MERAVVSIGVRKTGQLPELQAAVDSATDFAAWAREQKIPSRRVKLITDASGPVSRDRIFEAIQQITELGFIEQLIVYFSGHGINSGLFEQWLLSRAPDDPAAAVNVKGSEFGARFCGVGHVVFVSDACRTAADSIQAQRVMGGDIFPNVQPAGPERPVDQFYATLVGHPAFEVKTVEESASRFRAAYSTVLLKALRGEDPSLVERLADMGVVRPRPLKRHLSTAVPAFFTALNLGVSSQPDARIESEPDAWIAELPLPAPEPERPADRGPGRRRSARVASRGPGGGDAILPPLDVELRASLAPSLERDVSLELRAALHSSAPRAGRRAATEERRGVRDPAGEETRRHYDVLVAQGRTPFGPDHMESECGIKIRGARIASAYARYAGTAVETRQDVLRVDLPTDRRGANVLVKLADGSVVVAPAYRDFITGLSFDRAGLLEDVWCEPSANTARWRTYERRADDIRRLRAVIAASTALGVFRLDEAAEGRLLLDRLLKAGTVDPALAVYAAYAFHDRRMRAQIVDMQRHLDLDLGVRIFDVAMLAFSLGRTLSRDEPREMYPCVPMLTGGWALVSPLGIRLPGALGALRAELRPSLWTQFTAAAADRLEHELGKGELG
jgi:hypothetical protein